MGITSFPLGLISACFGHNLLLTFNNFTSLGRLNVFLVAETRIEADL
jgi:hypothetical protein